MKQKSMTLRLDNNTYDELQIAAAVKGQSITSMIRFAIIQHLKKLENDDHFQEKLEWHLNRVGKGAERLKGEEPR